MKKKLKLLSLLSLVWCTITSISAQNLKIMSFNIQQPYGTNWDGRKSSAVSIFNTTQADVIGTQEAVNYQRDYLAQQIGYAWYGSGRDGGDNGEGSWIFYNANKYTLDATKSGSFWLSDTPTVPSSFAGSYNRICTYVHLIEKSSGKGFYIFNSHFPTPEFSDARLKSMKLLVQQMTNRAIQSDPVYATGDFNSNEIDAVTLWMKNGSDNPIKFRDTYRDINPTGGVNTGFGTKYDYIYSPNDSKYTTHNSWVINSPVASDHYPIVAEVQYTSQTTTPTPVTSIIPGKIEAEDYSNESGVELENTTDIGTGKNLSYLETNDWVEYNVNVAAATNYILELRVASTTDSGKINILIDGQYNQTIALPITYGWQTWETVSKNIDLPAGLHTIKLQVAASGFNLNWFNFYSSTSSKLSIPGKIEAEDYTVSFGSQLEDTSDAGGGKNVGFLDVNDILEYSVNVSNSGTYNFDIRIASLDSGGRINILVDNQFKKSIDLPITGGWQNWQTLNTSIAFLQGDHQLKLEVVKSGFNLNWFNFSNSASSKSSNSKYSEVSDSSSFYPNPTKNYINFNAEYDWTVYTVSGEKILFGRSQKADMSTLKAGLYILYFNGNKKKLIIN